MGQELGQEHGDGYGLGYGGGYSPSDGDGYGPPLHSTTKTYLGSLETLTLGLWSLAVETSRFHSRSQRASIEVAS